MMLLFFVVIIWINCLDVDEPKRFHKFKQRFQYVINIAMHLEYGNENLELKFQVKKNYRKVSIIFHFGCPSKEAEKSLVY